MENLMQKKQFVSFTDDTLFKETFGRKKNIRFTERFMEQYFQMEPGSLKGKLDIRMETTFSKGKYKDKNSRGDVLIYMDDYVVSLEIYSSFDKKALDKVLFYSSRIYGTSLDIGQKYEEAKKFISINIVDNIKDVDLYEEWKSDYGYWYQTHQLTDKVTIVFLRLDLLREIPYNVCENDFITTLRVIGSKSEEERKQYLKKGSLGMTLEKFQKDFMNDEFCNKMFTLENKIRETGESIGRAEGLAKGRAEGQILGAKNRNNEIAQNMLKEKFDTSVISKVTGLSEQEIQSLQTT